MSNKNAYVRREIKESMRGVEAPKPTAPVSALFIAKPAFRNTIASSLDPELVASLYKQTKK